MKVQALLNKPYPIILNKWKITFFVGFFVALFMYIFQPFGLQSVKSDHKALLLLGYGSVSSFALVFNLFLVTAVFKKAFNETRWTVYKQILWLLWITFSISICNYLYSILVSVIPWYGLSGIRVFTAYTLPIAFLPIIAITFASQYLFMKQSLSASEKLNSTIESKSTVKEEKRETFVTIESGNQTYEFIVENIVFIESEGNYIHIHAIHNNKLVSTLIRSTMKNIDSKLHADFLFKCHRAFIVNTQFVEKVKGNSQGLLLTVKHIEKSIPVSRNNLKEFKEVINA